MPTRALPQVHEVISLRAYSNITPCVCDKASSRHGLAGLYHGGSRTIVGTAGKSRVKKGHVFCLVRQVDRLEL